MPKIIRYILLALGLVIILPIIAVGIFVAVFDANAYKQELSSLVQEQTGRELQFQGDVSLNFYPALGMKLGAMRFANAAGFGDQPMLRIGEASVSVDVLSLLRFAPEIDKLILRDLEINLMRNKAGVNNWDDLMPQKGPDSGSGAGTGADGESDKPKTSADSLAFTAAFAGLEIENLKLLWLDQQAGERYEVTDLDISTGRIVPNQSFPLTMHLDATTGADVKVAIDLQSDVEYLIDQQRISLQRMTLALNEFKIGGNLQVSNFAKPALRFDLESKLLDVDALLGTPTPEEKKRAEMEKADNAKQVSADEDVEIVLPMQILRDLDIDGDLRIAKLKMLTLNLSDFEMHLNAQQGLLSLKPVNVKAYEGEVQANVAIDVKGEVPKYGVGKSFKDVQAGDLLKDYLGESPISGRLNGEVNLTTRGEWLSKLKQNSNGTMSLEFLDGALNGFNLRQSIAAAKAKLTGGAPPAEKTLKTDFTSLTLSGVIRNGVFSSDDLDLQAPLLRLSGKGKADLNSDEVDYLVYAKLVGSLEGQQGGTAKDLTGLTIPVRIKGPFTDPKIDVKLDEMLKAKVDEEKERLKKEIDAQKKALEEQLKKEQKALQEGKQLELEKKLEVEKARTEKKLKDKLQNLFQ
jgi:AsmA protein